MESFSVPGSGRCSQLLGEQVEAQTARGLVAAVQVDRADQRLQAVGQDGAAPETTALQLAAAQAQHFTQPEAAGDHGQRLFPHQHGAHPRQIAFCRLRQAQEYRLADDEVEQRVAEELEALVVVAAGASVGERALQQRSS